MLHSNHMIYRLWPKAIIADWFGKSITVMIANKQHWAGKHLKENISLHQGVHSQVHLAFTIFAYFEFWCKHAFNHTYRRNSEFRSSVVQKYDKETNRSNSGPRKSSIFQKFSVRNSEVTLYEIIWYFLWRVYKIKTIVHLITNPSKLWTFLLANVL